MSGSYTVKQGDHLSSIAKSFGFSDYNTIGNDPNNADLKTLRVNPNVLNPGDVLFIPEHESRIEQKGTEVRHKFVAHRPPLKLKLVLEDLFEMPIANAKCDLLLDSDTFHLTSDDDGKIEQEIKPETKGGMLVINDPQTAFNGIAFPIKIGHLDPVEELSGQLARLDNLGYFPGDGTAEHLEEFKSAVEEFQCDNALTVDGICGPGTQAKLKEVHGC